MLDEILFLNMASNISKIHKTSNYCAPSKNSKVFSNVNDDQQKLLLARK
jgi:hypothetical protein